MKLITLIQGQRTNVVDVRGDEPADAVHLPPLAFCVHKYRIPPCISFSSSMLCGSLCSCGKKKSSFSQPAVTSMLLQTFPKSKESSSRAFEAALRAVDLQIHVFDSTDLRLPHYDARHNFQTVIAILSHSRHSLHVRRGDQILVTVVETVSYYSDTNPKSIVKNKHRTSRTYPSGRR